MFPRLQRLRKSSDIQRVVTHGNRTQTPNMRTYWLNRDTSQSGPARITVVVGKKVHKNAVVRNRLKRRVRAALKSIIIPNGLDVVVLPRIGILKLEFDLLKNEIEKIHYAMVK